MGACGHGIAGLPTRYVDAFASGEVADSKSDNFPAPLALAPLLLPHLGFLTFCDLAITPSRPIAFAMLVPHRMREKGIALGRTRGLHRRHRQVHLDLDRVLGL